jgi:hypothetical protein
MAPRHITLFVAPFGKGWSVKEDTAYYGEYRTRSEASEAAARSGSHTQVWWLCAHGVSKRLVVVSVPTESEGLTCHGR